MKTIKTKYGPCVDDQKFHCFMPCLKHPAKFAASCTAARKHAEQGKYKLSDVGKEIKPY